MPNALQIEQLTAGVVDDDGVALAGGKVYTYAAGTTDDKATYTDALMTTPAANPIILDDAGVANVYGYGNYKFDIYDANDAHIRTLNNQYYLIPANEDYTVTSYTDNANLSGVNQVAKANTASGNITFYLPSAVGIEGVFIYVLKTNAANQVTLDADTLYSQTVNGAASVTINAENEVIGIVSDNANWVVVNSNASAAVTLSGTQLLTNKSVYDSTFYIKDESDSTKILQFQCSGITTGTTRTLTVPDASGTIKLTTGDAAWADYSGTSTVVGWGAFTVKSIYYKRIGSLVFVHFWIQGTSDSISANFTVPYTAHAGPGILKQPLGQTTDAGATATSPGLIQLTGGEDVVHLGKTLALGTWTNSGTKTVIGQFFYEAAS